MFNLKNYKIIVFFILLFFSTLNANNNEESDLMPLTMAEKNYLKEKKQIIMCVDPNWMPFEEIKDNQHIGMAADYFKIFKKNIEIPIIVKKTKTWSESIKLAKKRECDIFSLSMKTKKRSKYMNFTNSYIDTPLVLATKPDVSFINNFNKYFH